MRARIAYFGSGVFLLPAFVSAKPSSTPQRRVTLAEAISIATQRNPSEKIAEYSELSARKNLVSQSAPANPTLNYGGLNNSVAAVNQFGNRANYNLYVTLETSGRWRYRTDVARWQFETAKTNTQGAHFGLVQSVTDAYISLQVANKDLENEGEAWNTAKKLRDLADAQFKLGAQPETAAIRAQIAFNQEDQNLVNAQANVAQARAALDNQMGIPPDEPVEAADPLTYDPANLAVEVLQKLALTHRFEIKAGEQTEQSLAATVKLNQADYYPDTLLGSDLQNHQLELGLVLPLDLGSIRGAVQKAEADVKVQHAQNEKQRQQVLLDVQSAYESLQANRKVVESFQSGIVPRAQSLLDRVTKGFTMGASTILDVIDAQETLRATMLAYNDAIGAYSHALNQLQLAVGLPTDQIRTLAARK